MKRLPIIVLLVGPLGVILVVAGFATTKPPADKSAVPAATSSPTTTQTPAANPATAPGAYTAYDAKAVASTRGTKILFFHAPWCPQCRALDASIKAGTVPAGVTIFKVDYDSNQALRKTYGVTIQTSLVKVDDSGKLIKSYVAYEQPTMAALQKNLLP